MLFVEMLIFFCNHFFRLWKWAKFYTRKYSDYSNNAANFVVTENTPKFPKLEFERKNNLIPWDRDNFINSLDIYNNINFYIFYNWVAEQNGISKYLKGKKVIKVIERF